MGTRASDWIAGKVLPRRSRIPSPCWIFVLVLGLMLAAAPGLHRMEERMSYLNVVVVEVSKKLVQEAGLKPSECGSPHEILLALKKVKFVRAAEKKPARRKKPAEAGK